LDATGLISKIYEAALTIDSGRKGFAIRGKADEGRLFYEQGIAEALSAFRDAQSTVDPQIIALVEYTYLSLELKFCDKTDTDTFGSLTQAIQSFKDALLALKIAEDPPSYKIAEQTYPNDKKHRVKNFPKDSYHIACGSHRTRLLNFTRTPGVDTIEKTLLKQRRANLSTAQKGYIEKQKKALLPN